jgi:electron transfer flavoprotein beta subunit
MSMNPFDEIAVEEAIRLKEQGKATEIVAVSIGRSRRRRRSGPRSPWGPIAASRSRTDVALEPLASPRSSRRGRLESPGLVILGKQAIDDDITHRPDAARPARLAARHLRVSGRGSATAPLT